MPVPEKGWKDMAEAPRDGDELIIAVRYHAYNGDAGPWKICFAQWLPTMFCDGFRWCMPYRPDVPVHTGGGWMYVEELFVALKDMPAIEAKPTISEQAATLTPKDGSMIEPEKVMEFDL